MKDLNKLLKDEEQLSKKLLLTKNRILEFTRRDEKNRFRIYGSALIRAEKDGPILEKTVGTILSLHVTAPKDRELVGVKPTHPAADIAKAKTNKEGETP